MMTRLFSCALQGSRTPNLLIRSQMLYPIELGMLQPSLPGIASSVLVMQIYTKKPLVQIFFTFNIHYFFENQLSP